MTIRDGDIRTYCHETLQGALAELKGDLGEDAYILHTRQVEKKGVLGIGSHPVFEIQACKRAPGPTGPNPLVTKAYGAAGPAAGPRRRMTQRDPSGESGPVAPRKDSDRRFERIEKTVDQMMSMMREVVHRQRESDDLAGLVEELQTLNAHLLDQGVKPCRAKALIQDLNQALSGEDLRSPRKLREALRQRLVDTLSVAPPVGPAHESRPRVCAFIGPTGVGKTTTISKLAGYYHHYEQRDVSLMTIDTYRIAAAEQLHRVAEIVDVPIRVETSPSGVERSLSEFAEKDLVLVDTAGRSPRDTLQMNELKKFLEAAAPDETYLVLPATQDAFALEQVVARFGPLANRIVLTKLDEAARLGPLLDLLVTANLPVAYWTFGQSIPDDIATVNARRLAGLLIGEETL